MQGIEFAAAKAVNFLTAITWWLDVRFSKSSIWLANLTTFLIEFFRVLEKFELPYILASTLMATIITTVIYYIFWTFKFVEESQKSPNKNMRRAPAVIVGGVIGSIITFLMFQSLAPGLIYIIYFLILCTEKVPPEEKELRIRRNKLAHNN